MMSALPELKPSADKELQRHAASIRQQLAEGVSKPYRAVIDVSSGDTLQAGMQSLSFVRQVMAGCLYPDLLLSDALPADVKLRVQSLLGQCEGASVGSYTASIGMASVQRSVAEFISRRDGGVPSNPEHIFIASGSQRAMMVILMLFARGKQGSQTGVMTPVPCPHTFPSLLERVGLVAVPYRLREEVGWGTELEELHRALQASRGRCRPKALYISNPGNPTGHVQSRKSIEEMIHFAAKQRLFLLVNEKYQDSVFGEGTEFLSYKKVLAEMGSPYSHTVELASFHSLSNGILGECGLRSGYVELVNVDPAVLQYAEALLCGDISAPLLGQIALDVMADPPQPGHPSFEVYSQEVASKQGTLRRNMHRAVEYINTLPGFCCQPVKAGVFIYPHLSLPHGALAHAQRLGIEAGLLYCKRLLEEQGVCVGVSECVNEESSGCHDVGSGWHIRLCVLMPSNALEEVLDRLRSFHLCFLREY